MKESPRINEAIEEYQDKWLKDVPSSTRSPENFRNDLLYALRQNKRNWLEKHLTEKQFNKLYNVHTSTLVEKKEKELEEKYTDLAFRDVEIAKGKRGEGSKYIYWTGISKKTKKRQYAGAVYYEKKEKYRRTQEEYEEHLKLDYDKIQAKPFNIEKEGAKLKGYKGFRYTGIDAKTGKKKGTIGTYYTVRKVKLDGKEIWLKTGKRRQIYQSKLEAV